jgi:hypothetical protein
LDSGFVGECSGEVRVVAAACDRGHEVIEGVIVDRLTVAHVFESSGGFTGLALGLFGVDPAGTEVADGGAEDGVVAEAAGVGADLGVEAEEVVGDAPDVVVDLPEAGVDGFQSFEPDRLEPVEGEVGVTWLHP